MSEGVQDEGSIECHQTRAVYPAVEPTADGTTIDDPDEFVATLVWRIAAELGCDPLSLPPLRQQIDLDAVASLATDGRSSLRFTCGNCEVFVGYDGQITVDRIK
ncbi:hypothetical protein C474_07607 [Halogeometricum pallidum JCM 14848]|uniref:Halobacterial output domain-containing protein n=1 Tax=Halogeometricum pallidum JCM 14848 TaxID=1227487 RepID=M0DD10_HALPD|nr:HalOD1 output domain-containing protein [Halogeometricum pallidum]ELZ32014.1 hypothetical protein C474_07607 [Halogeometricum pallidum JCM 14848]